MRVGKEVTLQALRAGATFVTQKGVMAVKSEYRYGDTDRQFMCILLESGEFAHFPEGAQEAVKIGVSIKRAELFDRCGRVEFVKRLGLHRTFQVKVQFGFGQFEQKKVHTMKSDSHDWPRN